MGKGEGLNPALKAAPRPTGACLQRGKPRSIGQLWFPPCPQGPSRASPAPGASRDLICSGMEEPVVRPSVFVVDGQTDIPFTRLGRRRRSRPCSVAQLGLGLLLLLLVAGLAVQGWFLLRLHWRLGEMVTPLLVSGARGGGRGGASVSLASLCARVCARQETGQEQPRASQLTPPKLNFLVC